MMIFLKFWRFQTWALSCVILIIFLILVGGITRLTYSGLSITEWQPITGIIPPIGIHEWNTEFEKYKKIPQFLSIHSSLTLEGFKKIFLWEYLHRLLARLLGLWAVMGLVVFTLKSELTKSESNRALKGIFLILIQGALGWFMVMSGLKDLNFVSHYRLSAHLLLGFFILSYWTQTALENEPVHRKTNPRHLKLLALLMTIQITLGAWVAGLKAGFISTTYPLMNDRWVPNFINTDFTLLGITSNPVLLHFTHRWFGFFVLISAIYSLLRSKHKKPALIFITLILIQFAGGILTVLSTVQIEIASFHQLNSCFLVMQWTIWKHHETTAGQLEISGLANVTYDETN